MIKGIKSVALGLLLAMGLMLTGLATASSVEAQGSGTAPSCPDGYTLESTECVQVVDAITTDVCPEGADGDAPDGCYTTSDASSELSCPTGTLVDEQCESTIERAEVCPEGYAAEAYFDWTCTRSIDAEQGPDTCPEGALGEPTEEPGGCYIITDLITGLGCLDGTLVDDRCVITGDAPIDGACADGFELVGDGCQRTEDPQVGDPYCDQFSELDDEGQCRRPVANAAGVYSCADDAAQLNGTLCTFGAEPELETCAEGEADGEVCVVRVDPETVLTCDAPAVPDDAGACRTTVDAVEGLGCEASDAVLDGNTCERSIAATCASGVLSASGDCVAPTPVPTASTEALTGPGNISEMPALAQGTFDAAETTAASGDAAVADDPVATGSTEIAFTGSETTALAAAGIALLWAGGALTVWARSPRGRRD